MKGFFLHQKPADRFLLRSHRIQLEWSRQLDDVFVSEMNFNSGTTVEFTIQRDARQLLEDIFSEFAPAHYDYQFQKTKVHVKLLKSEYVSRSEARRLVTNLEKFREIILDFKGVKSVGQGFAMNSSGFSQIVTRTSGSNIKTLSIVSKRCFDTWVLNWIRFGNNISIETK